MNKENDDNFLDASIGGGGGGGGGWGGGGGGGGGKGERGGINEGREQSAFVEAMGRGGPGGMNYVSLKMNAPDN